MANKLEHLVLDELSFVDLPANKAARVSIFKRSDAPKPDPRITKAVQPSATLQQEQSDMSAFSKAEAAIDSLVRKRRERHEDESEAVAMTKVLDTAEGKRAYAAMTTAKDLAVAKRSTLLTFESRNVSIYDVPPDYAGSVDAWAKLDQMAKDEAAKTGSPFYIAYARVIDTPNGRHLYAAGCAAPSLAGTVA